MGAQLEEFLPIDDREIAERGAALIVGDARERPGREGQRRVARREEIGEPVETRHGTADRGGRGGAGGAEGTGRVLSACARLRLSATTTGRGSRCTPSALPPTTTRSIRSLSIASVIWWPRE